MGFIWQARKANVGGNLGDRRARSRYVEQEEIADVFAEADALLKPGNVVTQCRSMGDLEEYRKGDEKLNFLCLTLQGLDWCLKELESTSST